MGPVYGHQVLKSSKTSKICDGAKWKSIVVRKSKISSPKTVIVCEDKDFGGFCMQLDSRYYGDLANAKPIPIIGKGKQDKFML